MNFLEEGEEPLADVEVSAVKTKTQGLRTSFREELRKLKKSQSTRSGGSEVYV